MPLALIMAAAALIFAWWLDIKNPTAFALPLGFFVMSLAAHWHYASVPAKQTEIIIFEEGLYAKNEFLHWNEIEAFQLKKTVIDTINYSLVVRKTDGDKLECSLDFFNATSDAIFNSAQNAFEQFAEQS